MNENLLFEISMKNYQDLVNVIKEYSSSDGICWLSQSEIASLLNKSQTWVSHTIRRLNSEEVCIERSNGGYSLRFDDIYNRGTCSKILNLMKLFMKYPYFWEMNENNLATELKIKRSTIQAAKAYLNDVIKNSRIFLSRTR